MRISVSTGIKVICESEWDSCRYTKGEGFCLDENSQGISLEYSAVFVDDVKAFLSEGGHVSDKMLVKRIHHPELAYVLDVDSVTDEQIPSISSVGLTPSLSGARKYIQEHSFLTAEPCLVVDDSFTMVDSTVVVEAFRESSDQ